MTRIRNDLDTICAVATAPGRGAIALIRVSGAEAAPIVRKIASFLPETLESHRAYYGHLKSIQTSELIDEVLALYFERNKSFTTEQTIEITCHGSSAITQRIMLELVAAGARAAEPGEFTYRAFMNGRIDLAQAEAVQDLVLSKNESARRLSLRQLSGAFSVYLKEIEEELLWCLSRLEANIDFAQEDIEFAKHDDITARIRKSLDRVRSLLASYASGQAVTAGIKVALIGRPNVGKSSLLNAIIQQDKAIVSPNPGTTRDTVEGSLMYKGLQIDFVDTAGLRLTNDEVESVGIQKSIRAAAESDVLLVLQEGAAKGDMLSGESIIAEYGDALPETTLRVFTKSDIHSYKTDEIDNAGSQLLFASEHCVSSKTRDGIEDLLAAICKKFVRTTESENVTVINARHYEELRKAELHLSVAASLSTDKESPDFIIAEAQEGLRCIMRILGKEFDDEILDKVFRDFCLGK